MPKLRAFNLGLLGVNVREGPLHLKDGEFVAAQNAELSRDLAETAIVKRKGIEGFTPDALGAAIAALTSIPLPDPYVPLLTEGARLYAPTSTDGITELYQHTANGTSWTVDTGIGQKPGGPIGGGGIYSNIWQHGGFLTLEDGMYFLDAMDGHLMRWNGNALQQVSDNEAGDVSSLDVRTILLHQGAIYGVGDFGTNTAIIRFTGTSWEEVVFATSGNEAYVACSAFGRIYMCGILQEMAYWSEDTGYVFTPATYFTGGNGSTMPPTDMVMTPTGLIVALDRNGQQAHLLFRLTDPDGAWENLTPVGSEKGVWGPMALFNDVLYIARHTSAVGGGAIAWSGCEVWKYDGTSVTLDADLTATLANAQEIRSMIVFNDHLYMSVMSGSEPARNIMRRTAAGVYSTVVSEQSISQDAPRGELGFF